MADKLLIVIMNSDPTNIDQLVSPLQQARVAAAMEYQVEVILAGRAGCLALDSDDNPVRQQISQARDQGVCFKVCTTALGEGVSGLLPEIDEVVGDTYLISEAMDSQTVTFTY